MTWGFVPPAVSDVFLPSVIARLLRGDSTALDDEICDFLGCRAAATGSSWVLVLRHLLEQLASRRPGRVEVVLPSYSCNEFTKATLLAGLRPRYVDLRDDLAADPAAIATAIGPATLAAFSINNLGRESDNAAIRSLCDQRNVLCIEDATYTFLGTSDRDQRRFGSYGHYAVLNFSEGKIIPVGGGAVLTNVDDGVAVIDDVRARIGERPPASGLRELVSLVVYRAGSSRMGYSAYRLLRELTGADLKKRLSMEPTRTNEVGNDLERDARGHVVLRAERSDLDSEAALRPLGRAKQLCGSEVIRHADDLREHRHARYAALRRSLAGSAVELFPLPAGAMPVKAPFIIDDEVQPHQQRELDRLGVARGYSTEYPTYGDPSSPNSNRYFERMYTLPVHGHVHTGIARDIAALLGRFRARPSPRDVTPLVQPRLVNEAE